MKAKAQQDAEAALAEPLDVFRSFFLDGKRFIGGDTPSIADIRLAATLEFLNAIDYEFPAWAEEYMTAMESDARRGLLGAGRRRARLHRLSEVTIRLPPPLPHPGQSSPGWSSCSGRSCARASKEQRSWR